jgi:hypothetical protein
MNDLNVEIVQKAVIFLYRFKGHGSKRVLTRLVATYARNVYTEDSAKW